MLLKDSNHICRIKDLPSGINQLRPLRMIYLEGVELPCKFSKIQKIQMP